MTKKINLIKKITLTLGILMILLGLLPVSGLSRIGSVFADDNPQPPDDGGGEVCGEAGCENLPAMGEGSVDGTFRAEQVIPSTNDGGLYSGMTGDLTVDGETFDNVPAICGDRDTRIYLGQNTPFQICSVTDTDCINAIRAAQSAAAFTPAQADQYGRTLDTIYEQSVTSNDYWPAIGAFRWMTGDVTGADPFVGYLPSESISTWIGRPENLANQPLAFWLDCYDDCPDEQTCPEHCGYAGGTVADGHCGTKQCAAVPVPPAEQCPDDCGYQGGQVPDGQCGFTDCPAIDPPPAVRCPNYCGYPGGDVVSNGKCGTRTCPAVNCEGGIVPVTAEELIIPVTGVHLIGDLQFAALNSGLALIGVRCLIEGFNRRKKK